MAAIRHSSGLLRQTYLVTLPMGGGDPPFITLFYWLGCVGGTSYSLRGSPVGDAVLWLFLPLARV